MPQPMSSGPISAERDMVAHLINTGQINTERIEQHTHLSLNIITERLDQLAGLLAQADGALHPAATETLEVTAVPQAPLPLSDNLLEALRLLPHAVDAPLALRCRAYAAWLVTR